MSFAYDIDLIKIFDKFVELDDYKLQSKKGVICFRVASFDYLHRDLQKI